MGVHVEIANLREVYESVTSPTRVRIHVTARLIECDTAVFSRGVPLETTSVEAAFL